jgi:HSP20 family molecular chaperone IbpA
MTENKKKDRKFWFEGEKPKKQIRKVRRFSEVNDVPDMDKQMTQMFNLVGKMFGKSFMRGFSQPTRKPIRFNVRVGMPKINAGLSINMRDTGKELVLQANLAGVDKKDVKLNVTSNTVEIVIEKGNKKVESQENFYSQTSSSSTVRRAVRLPVEIDENSVRAKFMEGNLIIVLPKLRQTKKRNVEVE